MKNIKVRAIFGSWQGYQEIVNYPPKSIEYLGVSEETKEGKYYEGKKLKEFLSSIIQRLRLPRMLPINLFGSKAYDLVHSSRGIIPIQFFSNKPWVMDIEHVHSFFSLNPKLIKKKFWKKFIENRLASKNCKAILCHCDATRQSFFHYLDCKKFKDKIKVLYPASHILKINKEKHKKIRILCVLSLFENKAGLQVLKAFTELEKKHKNIELWIKSDVPEEIKKKYDSQNIKYFGYFSEIVSREKLIKNFYSKGDIFLYPSLCDSFGYSMIDALVAGLPIVSTNLFAFPEIVEENVNGYLVKIPGYNLKKEFKQYLPKNSFSKKEEKEFISSLVGKLDKLILDKKLREKMGDESFRLVSTGKFSLKERNKQLRKIYEEALK